MDNQESAKRTTEVCSLDYLRREFCRPLRGPGVRPIHLWPGAKALGYSQFRPPRGRQN